MQNEQEVHDQLRNLVYAHLSQDDDNISQINELMEAGKSRLIVSIYHFNVINPEFSSRLLNDPFTFLPPCEEAFKQIFETANAAVPVAKRSPTAPRIGFRDWLGPHTVTPRGLSSRLVNRLICVEGIVTRCSLVHPKLVQSVHYAEESGKHMIRSHNDSMAVQRDRHNTAAQPKADAEGNVYRVEIGLSDYKDFQRLTIQEMPESAPTGQLPRAVDIVVEEDLVDAAKPGDRVRVFGVYRSVAHREQGKVSGYAKTFIIANNVEQLRKDVQTPDIGPTDIRNMRNLAARDDAFEVLSRSVAPSICGHELIKKGLLLQLLGGQRKALDNGMKLRGDIHVLLIGDPSCGKSQMLRFMMNTAPLALSTTGRGSSGVGLTAAVSSDQDTGERRLEAGAMVLADMGVVCIDEFDKMSHEDRVAIHEVMEQQTVTISKAGIQTSLNARCSVVAAANPLYGNFDDTADLKTQIAFPDSLLSRFDLIYVVRDAQSSEHDRRICTQVLKQLQYREEGDNGLSVFQEDGGHKDNSYIIQPTRRTDTGEAGSESIWQRSTALVPHDASSQAESYKSIVSVDFLRKFIYYCKNQPAPPKLSDAAMEEMSEFYADLRQRFVKSAGQNRNLSLPTARTLEACIRLATAHAKLKLHSLVEVADVRIAKQLLLYTLLGESPSDEADESGDSSSDEDAAPRRTRAKKAATPSTQQPRSRPQRDAPASAANSRRKRGSKSIAGNDEATLAESLSRMSLREPTKRRRAGDTPNSKAKAKATPRTTVEGISVPRYREFMKLVSAVQAASGAESVARATLFTEVNAKVGPSKAFSEQEFEDGISQMQIDNHIMFVQDTVWFVM